MFVKLLSSFEFEITDGPIKLLDFDQPCSKFLLKAKQKKMNNRPGTAFRGTFPQYYR